MKIIIIIGLFLSMEVQAHYEIFPSCLKDNNQHRNYTAHDVEQENIELYKPIKKKPSKYPRKALNERIEGVVILEYTINNKG